MVDPRRHSMGPMGPRSSTSCWSEKDGEDDGHVERGASLWSRLSSASNGLDLQQLQALLKSITDDPATAVQSEKIVPELYCQIADVTQELSGTNLPTLHIRYENIRVTTPRAKQSLWSTITHRLRSFHNKVRAFSEVDSPGRTERRIHMDSSTFLPHPKSPEVHEVILKDISGVIAPGSVTLVLGKPGSGKSVYLKTLSQHLSHNTNLKVSGDIRYNEQYEGYYQGRLKRILGYVSQDDAHFADYTVQETMDFAHTMLNGKHFEAIDLNRYGIPTHFKLQKEVEEVFHSIHENRGKMMLEVLGLGKCKHTPVGNGSKRGISGGEAKRLTLGELLLSRCNALFLDEMSNGLDSAATLTIMKHLRHTAKVFRTPIVAVLQQPTPEVFNEFDDVVILDQGNVLYHGPTRDVVSYFNELGFQRPKDLELPEYLLDILSYKPRGSSDYYAQAFRNSSLLRERLYPFASDPINLQRLRYSMQYDAERIIQRKEFQQTISKEIQMLLLRELTLLSRNTRYWVGRSIMTVSLALLYGSVFWQIDLADPLLLMGLCFTVVLFSARGQLAHLPLMMEGRSIFYKQRECNFYRTTSYVLASVTSQIPIAFAETLTFGNIVYFMCGFAMNGTSYIIYLSTLFMTNFFLFGMFYFLSGCLQNTKALFGFTTVLFALLTSLSGYVIAFSQIPSWWKWAYYMNPLSWSIKTIMIGQYKAPVFQVDVYHGVNASYLANSTAGDWFLTTPFNIPTETFWIFCGLAFLMFVSVVEFILAGFFLHNTRFHRFVFYPDDRDTSEFDDCTNSHRRSVTTPFQSLCHRLTKHKDRSKQLFMCQECTNSNRKSPQNFVQVDIVEESSAKIATLQQVEIAFRSLYYSVPSPKETSKELRLLSNINGTAQAGRMTALMGPSGAGKSTLLDVLAGRKTIGTISGDILFNGRVVDPDTRRRVTGYCEQSDVHFPFATVLETLQFVAILRQGRHVTQADKMSIVQKNMEMLELLCISDRLANQLSPEQRKRLTIACELVANPSVLFLDEPTTGLDAMSAKRVVHCMKRISRTGRTLICTIHQPSAYVFSMFDDLLLMQSGRVVYFGSVNDSVRLIEGIPNVSKYVAPYNPASYVLEVVAEVTARDGEDAMYNWYTQSTQWQAKAPSSSVASMDTSTEQINRCSVFEKPDVLDNDTVAFTTQMKVLLRRFFLLQMRNHHYNLGRVFNSLIQAFLYGSMYFNFHVYDASTAQSGMGLIFVVFIQMGVQITNFVIPMFSEVRKSFYKDMAAKTYHPFYYTLAALLVEIPLTVALQLLFTVPFGWLVGFGKLEQYAWLWSVLSLLALYQVYLGYFLVAILPSESEALLALSVMTPFYQLLSGINPPTSRLPFFWGMLRYVVPVRYGIAAVAASSYAYCPPAFEGSMSRESNYLGGYYPGCNLIHDGVALNISGVVRHTYSVKTLVEEYYDMDYAAIPHYTLVLLGFCILIALATAVALRSVNYTRR